MGPAGTRSVCEIETMKITSLQMNRRPFAHIGLWFSLSLSHASAGIPKWHTFLAPVCSWTGHGFFLQALWLYRWNLLTKSWQNSGDFWEGNDSRCVPAGGFLDAGGSDTPSFARRRLLACSTQLCRLGKLFFTPGLQRQISFFRTAMSKFPL